MLPANPAKTDIHLLKETMSIFKKLAEIMGILREDAATYLRQKKATLLAGLDIDEDTIDTFITERYEARKAKDWKRSDEIRDILLGKNIELKDGPEGTTWGIKRSSKSN